MENFTNFGAGLKKLYIAELGTLICTVLALIPVVNIVAGIVLLGFAVLSMIGLSQAGTVIKGCKTAFILTIILLIFDILQAVFAPERPGIAMYMLLYIIPLTIINGMLSFLVVYYICTSVNIILTNMQKNDIAKFGNIVWIIILFTTIFSIALKLIQRFSYVFDLWLKFLVNGSIAVLSIVNVVLLTIFLGKSSRALQS